MRDFTISLDADSPTPHSDNPLPEMVDVDGLDPEFLEEVKKARLDLAPSIGHAIRRLGVFKAHTYITTTAGRTHYFFVLEDPSDEDRFPSLVGKTIANIRITGHSCVFQFADGDELALSGWLEEDFVHIQAPDDDE